MPRDIPSSPLTWISTVSAKSSVLATHALSVLHSKVDLLPLPCSAFRLWDAWLHMILLQYGTRPPTGDV